MPLLCAHSLHSCLHLSIIAAISHDHGTCTSAIAALSHDHASCNSAIAALSHDHASRIRAGCLWSGPAPHGCHRTQPTPKSDAELRRHPRPWPVQAHVRVAAGPGPPGRKARVSHVWGAAPAHPSCTPPCSRRDAACAAHQGPSFTIPPPASQQSPARARRVPQRI